VLPTCEINPESTMTKLLELLNASNKIAIALVLAGLVFLLNETFHFIPFPIPYALAGWMTLASVLGACVLFANITAWFYSVAGQGGKGLRRWWNAWTVMSRLNELTSREQLALFWIAYHPNKTISGSRFLEPFKRLSDKGYLIATDPSGVVQGFKVNSRVYAGKKKLRKLLPERVHHYDGDMAPPRR
jgi:hypothetical protein